MTKDVQSENAVNPEQPNPTPPKPEPTKMIRGSEPVADLKKMIE